MFVPVKSGAKVSGSQRVRSVQRVKTELNDGFQKIQLRYFITKSTDAYYSK